MGGPGGLREDGVMVAVARRVRTRERARVRARLRA